MSHTPGPWVLDSCHDGWQLLANGSNVTAEPFDCSDADARLIASAPQLLAALKGLLPWHNGTAQGGVWTDALAAINKAEGRGE